MTNRYYFINSSTVLWIGVIVTKTDAEWQMRTPAQIELTLGPKLKIHDIGQKKMRQEFVSGLRYGQYLHHSSCFTDIQSNSHESAFSTNASLLRFLSLIKALNVRKVPFASDVLGSLILAPTISCPIELSSLFADQRSEFNTADCSVRNFSIQLSRMNGSVIDLRQSSWKVRNRETYLIEQVVLISLVKCEAYHAVNDRPIRLQLHQCLKVGHQMPAGQIGFLQVGERQRMQVHA